MTIYFDNASTTLYKPKQVAEIIYNSLLSEEYGNSSRGSHDYSLNSFRAVNEVREKVKKLLHATDNYEVTFTNNSTTSLNMMIKGLINKNEHVITTCWEHNAVLRPLYQMEKHGVTFSVIQGDVLTGRLDLTNLSQLIQDNTSTIIVNHGSNVTGNVIDLQEIGEFCKKHDLTFIVDASQTMGQYPISLEDENVDILCFTGHKSLYGPTGTGGICLKKSLATRITPLISGGDGMQTFSKAQPMELPSLLEAGTIDVIGIRGLGAGIDYVTSFGIETINQHVNDLSQFFINGLKDNPNIQLYGYLDKNKTGVVSLNINTVDSAIVSDYLWDKHQIAIRSGYHCAPLMHETLGTKKQGTLRFSFSILNTSEEVDRAINALNKLSRMC